MCSAKPLAESNSSQGKSNDFLLWLIIIQLALLIRLQAGLHPHSGMNDAPLYGDYEAQRHWIEITSHVPLGDWYRGVELGNELSYWGLDYPPLTALHSFLMGKVYYAWQHWMCSLPEIKSHSLQAIVSPLCIADKASEPMNDKEWRKYEYTYNYIGPNIGGTERYIRQSVSYDCFRYVTSRGNESCKLFMRST